jgi:hypothetical protein
MPTAANNPTVNHAFVHPLEGLAAASSASQPCPEFSDDDYLRLGVQRVLESSESGRAFLQEHGVRFENTPELGNYFAALRSPRRGEVLRDVSTALLNAANPRLHDRLVDIPELANYECFACDGHWHKAAVHDLRHEGSKMAVGHFYSLNLRTHTLRHLAAGEGLHEHDMSALKRIKPKGLRQGVPKGKRVLIIYDKAGIDFAYWKRCRQECAVYFISRVKENMVFDWLESVPVDASDRRNVGVTEDRRVMSRDGHLLRIIFYTDPQTGEKYEFLTNEPDLPPGVIVELYRRRWEAEKTFDGIKNKLGEKKAWATSLVAKEAQAQFIAITHNLLLLYEQQLERQHGVTNQAEDERRKKRIQAAVAKCEKAGESLSTLVTQARRATQRSVKFVRWVRQAIRDQTAEALAVLRLMDLYASL